MPTDDNENVGIAFGLVLGAGAATALGASVVFVPSLVKLASRRVLAGALGLSAGVMTYVSFAEIFQKSSDSFVDAGHSEEDAYLYATLCFFGGVVFMLLVDIGVKKLGGDHHHDGHADQNRHGHAHLDFPSELDEDKNGDATKEVITPHCICCADDPAGDLDRMQHMAEEIASEQQNRQEQLHSHTETANLPPATDRPVELQQQQTAAASGNDWPRDGGDEASTEGAVDDVQKEKEVMNEHKKLVRMGVNTALAIGLHNFPEGLATFVAAMDDPRVGAILAVAIGIHNIPEGLCVAMPIYYATENRCKAFMWALVSGVSEPLAALLGWAILANSFSDDLYAILFGFVAGMMVIISVRELLPTAHRYDPEDSVVTFSFIGGMVIMALSLVLFLL